jgi:hypothetical protein
VYYVCARVGGSCNVVGVAQPRPDPRKVIRCGFMLQVGVCVSVLGRGLRPASGERLALRACVSRFAVSRLAPHHNRSIHALNQHLTGSYLSQQQNFTLMC